MAQRTAHEEALCDHTSHLLYDTCNVNDTLQLWQLEDLKVGFQDSAVWDHQVTCSPG